MKKLALLLLALPLAACATSPGEKSASYSSCVPHSHWDVAIGCGTVRGFARAPEQGSRLPNYPVYSPAGWGSGEFNN